MAKGKKTGGKNFEPGWAGGPGRPALPADLKEARALTRVDFERLINKFLFMGKSELEKVKASNESTAIELLISSIVLKAANDGDHLRTDFLLNRLIGKVQEKLEVSMPEPFIIRRPGGETVEMGVKKKEDET